MLDQQHRVPVVADRADQLDQGGLLAGVESGRRLVEAQQLGFGGQRASDLQAPLIAVGQILGLLLAAVGDTDELQQCGGLLDGVAFLPAVPRGANQRPGNGGLVPRVGADHHVLQRRHLAPQPDVLERPCDAQPRDLMALAPPDPLPVEHHRSGGGPVDTGDGVEAGGFARPIGSDEAEDLPAAYREVH